MKLTPKSKKIINIVVDVVVAIILFFAFFLTICTINSRRKGYDQYTEVFGSAYLAVATNSMAKDFETGEVGKDNFSSGDLIKITLIKGDAVNNLKVGDIITFKDSAIIIKGKWRLNSHRIQSITLNEDGTVKEFITKGDNNEFPDPNPRAASEVIGVYKGKAGGIGKLFLFMGTSAGFFVCVVLPTLLIVAYCAVNLFLVIRKEKKVQTVAAAQAQEDERERIRQELLAEMQAEQPVKEKEETAPEQSETVAEETEVKGEAEPAVSENANDEQSAQDSDTDEEDKK